MTDRFGFGDNFDALTAVPGNVGFGPNLFYYLRRDVTGLTLILQRILSAASEAARGWFLGVCDRVVVEG